MKKILFTLYILCAFTLSTFADSPATTTAKVIKRFSGNWSGYGYVTVDHKHYDYSTIDFTMSSKGILKFVGEKKYWNDITVTEPITGSGKVSGVPTYKSVIKKNDLTYVPISFTLSDGAKANVIIQEFRHSNGNKQYTVRSCKFKLNKIYGYCNFTKDPAW